MKEAIIIGHNGQDGSYLFELLAKRGYTVTGIGRESVSSTLAEIPSHIDLCQRDGIHALLAARPPQEIYYLAAFHHSAEMDRPDDYNLLLNSLQIHTLGLLNLLDGVLRHAPKARVFYAASSHLFGDPSESPQSEITPFQPRDAYGITKLVGVNLMRYYRDTHGLYCACGILYNHESPRRSLQFLTRKIVSTAVAIKRKHANQLRLGDMSAKVDWGYAPDYVDAMWRILQLDTPDDFVIASSRLHTVLDFVKIVFSLLDLDWRDFVVEDLSVITKQSAGKPLQGDFSKLRKMTGWSPRVDLPALARIMVESELAHDRD